MIEEPGLVSVIIPVYNRRRRLQRACQSVQAQTRANWEMIIVDDGSDEGTVACIDRIVAVDPRRIRAVRQANAGPGAARERGRLLARGEFVQYLDSDDVLQPDKLARQVKALADAPEAVLAYCITRHEAVPVDAAWRRTGEPIQDAYPAMVVDRLWHTSTPLYRRAHCADVQWPALRQDEDWLYDCRVLASGRAVIHVPHVGLVVSKASADSLQGGWRRSTALLRDRCLACHGVCELVYDRPVDRPAMRHLARQAFALARIAGARGLREEARALLSASVRLVPDALRHRAETALFRLASADCRRGPATALAWVYDRMHGS